MDVDTKLLPFAVSVKADPPGAVDTGEILVNVGAGLFTVTDGEEAMFVNVPLSEALDCVVKVYTPPEGGAAAPLAPPPAPYTTLAVTLAGSDKNLVLITPPPGKVGLPGPNNMSSMFRSFVCALAPAIWKPKLKIEDLPPVKAKFTYVHVPAVKAGRFMLAISVARFVLSSY